MKFTNPILLSLVCTVLVPACSEKSPVEIPESLAELENLTVYQVEEEPNSSIEFIEETTFGDTEDVIIGNISGVAVDTDGRVFIGDHSINTIHVFESDGSYLTAIGRDGSGPGEFRAIMHMRIGNGLLHIYDWQQQRINAFSLETFELVHTTSLDFTIESNADLSGWRVFSYFVLKDGNYLVQLSLPHTPGNMNEDRSDRLYKVSTEGNMLSDILFELPVGELLVDNEIPLVMSVPYARRSIVTVSGDNLYKMWTENLAIKKFSTNGEYKSAFLHTVDKSPLVRSQFLALYDDSEDMIRRVVRNASLPETWPAVNGILIDDESRFWVSRIIDDQDLYEWWILDDNGELINRFDLPRNSIIQQVKNNFLYTLENDAETGEQRVVKYRIGFS